MRLIIAQVRGPIDTLREDLTVESLAGRMGMSARHFTRVCLRETGMNPGHFVDRMRVEAARQIHFREDILQAFYDGIKHKPETTFGNVKADVLADKDPGFHRGNFCSVIRNSPSRDQSVRRSAQDDDSVGVLRKTS
jgi:hypothetical protein